MTALLTEPDAGAEPTGDAAPSLRAARRHQPAWAALPAVVLFVVGFVGPLVMLLLTSLGYSADNHTLSFDAYRHVFDDPAQFRVIGNTITTSLLVVALSVVIGYPVALCFMSISGWRRTALAIIIVGSLLVNSVIRVFGWLVLFVPNGFVSDQFSVDLLYTHTATVIGLLHLFMPFMILSLITSLSSIDPVLIRAATSLGAGMGRIMARVVLPLSLPGLVSGSIIVFGATTGSVVTPLLLGGADEQLVTVEVYRRTFVSFDPTGAASLAACLLILNIVLVTLVQLGNRRLERRLHLATERG
ncbi:ABC transporter permease [Actinophytocola sp.]|uniref:ABC transporter permease n=1 Tax=Actinophytocola sp. TaxID=1872138 RepID=UPI003D6A685B